METGIEYETRRLLTDNEIMDSELRLLLQHSRTQIESLEGINAPILGTLA